MVTAADRAAATCQRWGPCSYYRSCSFLTYKSGNDHERRCRFFASRALHVRGGSVSRRGLNQTARNRTHLNRRNQFHRSNHLKRQLLFGREGSGGRGASLREAASPPRVPFRVQRWQVAAALSAAVTITKPIGDYAASQAEPRQKKRATRTPAALREKGSGEEGKDSHSRQWRLSMAVFLNRNKRP